MHHHRPTLPTPPRRHPRLAAVAAVADALCAVTLGTFLAACLVHWAACEGMC